MKKQMLVACIFAFVSACSSSSGGDSASATGTDGTTATSNTDGNTASDGADGVTAADDVASVIAANCKKIDECGVDYTGYEFTNEEECLQHQAEHVAEIETSGVADPAQCIIDNTTLLRCVNGLACEAFIEYETSDDYQGECIELESPASCSPE